MKKIEKLKKKINSSEMKDGFLVFNRSNLLYLIGLPGSSALLIPKDGDCIVYSHDVNYAYLKKKVKDCKVVKIKSGENILKKIVKKTNNLKIKNLFLDSATTETWNNLLRISNEKIKFGLNKNLIRDLRKIKSKKEIIQLKKAGEVTIKGMQVAAEFISPGIKELEVAAEIEYSIKKHDYSGIAFETIVASGKSSAFPHGSSSRKKICKGDIVVVDVGAKHNLYCSDMTRTFIVGRASKKQNKIIKIVKKAQTKALEVIKDGLAAQFIDSVARKVIEKEGYGEYFVHSLGHGVGLEVHEQPILGPISKSKLKAGNVVTIEPGIYIENFGGVRIEDTILIKKNSIEKFTDGVNDVEL